MSGRAAYTDQFCILARAPLGLLNQVRGLLPRGRDLLFGLWLCFAIGAWGGLFDASEARAEIRCEALFWPAETRAEELERLTRAQIIMERELTPAESRTLLEAHRIGMGEDGRSGHESRLGEYTWSQLRRKAEHLLERGFLWPEVRRLMEAGVLGRDPVRSWVEELRLEPGESVLLTPRDGGLPHLYHFVSESLGSLKLRDVDGQVAEVRFGSIQSLVRARPFYARGERVRVQWVDQQGKLQQKMALFQALENGQWRFQEINSGQAWSLSAELLRRSVQARRGGIQRLDPIFWSSRWALRRGEDKVQATSWQGVFQGIFADETPTHFILLRDRVVFEIEKSQMMSLQRIREYSVPPRDPRDSKTERPQTENPFAQSRGSERGGRAWRPYSWEDFARKSNDARERSGSADTSHQQQRQRTSEAEPRVRYPSPREFLAAPESIQHSIDLKAPDVQVWRSWVLALHPHRDLQAAAWIMGFRELSQVNKQDLKNAYRRLARRLHPDLNRERPAQEQTQLEDLLKQVNLANQVLEQSLSELR
jgi:hypothetical protein